MARLAQEPAGQVRTSMPASSAMGLWSLSMVVRISGPRILHTGVECNEGSQPRAPGGLAWPTQALPAALPLRASKLLPQLSQPQLTST